MTTITDEFMRQMMSTTKNYCVVILKAGPNRNEDRGAMSSVLSKRAAACKPWHRNVLAR